MQESPTRESSWKGSGPSSSTSHTTPLSLDSGTHMNIMRSESLDGAAMPSLIRLSTVSDPEQRQDSLRRRSSSSISRDIGDRILSSIRLSHELVDQMLGDVDSSLIAQVGDSGDRVVEDEVGEDHSLKSHSDAAKSFEHRVGPLPDDGLSLFSPVSPLTQEIASILPKDALLGAVEKDQEQPVQSSSPKDKQYKLPSRVDHCSYLIHLSVFGFLGVFTRYLLQKLFGPSLLALTSDQSPLYLDLPANIAGSFFMGWLGIVFKADIRHVSEHLIVGLTTGYMGSLTTFSGWNQKMLNLSSQGHWVFAVAGIVLGMLIVNESITLGVESAEGLRRWFITKSSRYKCNLEVWRVDSSFWHAVVMTLMLLILLLLWILSGVLAVRKLHSLADGTMLWLGCLVSPPGVWARWYLARLNGEGIGRGRYLKWLPIGTLAANVLAACIMAALAVTGKALNTQKSGLILSGIEFGFLGCMSTVSTFVTEVYTMRRSGHGGRAFIYVMATFGLSFVLGTLIYSVPVWAKHYN